MIRRFFMVRIEIHVVDGVAAITNIPGLSMEAINGMFEFVPSYVIVMVVVTIINVVAVIVVVVVFVVR